MTCLVQYSVVREYEKSGKAVCPGHTSPMKILLSRSCKTQADLSIAASVIKNKDLFLAPSSVEMKTYNE